MARHILLVATLFCAGPALAATASASLDKLRFTVTDLDARDGIAAGYRIAGDPPRSTVGVALATATSPLANRGSRVAPAWLAPLSVKAREDAADGRGEITARGILAAGAARAPGTHFVSETLVQSSSQSQASTIGLVLKAHTQLVITADAHVAARGEHPCPQPGCEMAAASVGLGSPQAKGELVWLSASTAAGKGKPYGQERRGTLTITLRNTGDRDAVFGLWLHAQVWGDGGGAKPPPSQSAAAAKP